MGEETKAHGICFKGPKKEKHKRTITIDDDLLALLLSARDRLLRLKAGIPDGVAVDLSPVVPYKGRASAKTIAREFSCLFKETECAVSPGTGGDLNKSEKSEDTRRQRGRRWNVWMANNDTENCDGDLQVHTDCRID